MTFIPFCQRLGEYPERNGILAIDVFTQFRFSSALAHFQCPTCSPDGLEEVLSFTLFQPLLCSLHVIGIGCFVNLIVSGHFILSNTDFTDLSIPSGKL